MTWFQVHLSLKSFAAAAGRRQDFGSPGHHAGANELETRLAKIFAHVNRQPVKKQDPIQAPLPLQEEQHAMKGGRTPRPCK